jgi:4'-phosphopantetheinyl transferase EntD
LDGLDQPQTRARHCAGRAIRWWPCRRRSRRAPDGARPRASINSIALTAAEREVIDGLALPSHREATLVRFAIKEAVYKAIDPYVGRYVRFTEVELDVLHDGQATVRLLLPEPAMQHVHVEARWRFEDRWIIAMARSVRR